jgi:glutamine phosphoribosylpyrophosphate amidotransferase
MSLNFKPIRYPATTNPECGVEELLHEVAGKFWVFSFHEAELMAQVDKHGGNPLLVGILDEVMERLKLTDEKKLVQ